MTQSDVNVILAELRFMNEKWEAMVKSQEDHSNALKEHIASDDIYQKDLLKELKKDFSSKWVENLFVGMVSLILIAFLGTLISGHIK